MMCVHLIFIHVHTQIIFVIRLHLTLFYWFSDSDVLLSAT